MKIAIFVSRSDFSEEQQKALSTAGETHYVEETGELTLEELIKTAAAGGAEVIAPDPDAFGGFEKAKPLLTGVMESLPNLKSVCLSTTSFGWIDMDYCKKRGISVSNVPGYSRESVAEHALALMLSLAKRIIVTDRRTQKGVYKSEEGFELKGKTLGIIGLGNIGTRVAELGQGVGMRVVATDIVSKNVRGVEMKSFKELLKESDVISLHATHEEKNKELIGRSQIALMKDGVIIVNTVDRELVDEQAMAEAINSKKVYGYAYEGEDLVNTPLANLENAVGIKGFGWYTKESLVNLYKIWVDNIVEAAKGNPRNRIV
ncbi:MAG: 2-hydroxyacid dehydrogenase [bacterium]